MNHHLTKLSVLLLLVLPGYLRAQADDAIKDVLAFQKDLNKEYSDPATSPLEKKALRHFKGVDFYPIDLAYRVHATLEKMDSSQFFGMKTTTTRLPNYRVYGIVTFSLQGETFHLPVYQSQDLMQTDKYRDLLFFPFTDQTNGDETYGGGRYIDLYIPKDGNVLTIDFNKAYNPNCAYSHHYSCPLVPDQNYMDIEVRAGVRLKQLNKH